MDEDTKRETAVMLAIAFIIASQIGHPALAEDYRGAARTFVTANHDVNVNRNANVNVNRNVDVNVHGGY
jgi:hypothetical protein